MACGCAIKSCFINSTCKEDKTAQTALIQAFHSSHVSLYSLIYLQLDSLNSDVTVRFLLRVNICRGKNNFKLSIAAAPQIQFLQREGFREARKREFPSFHIPRKKGGAEKQVSSRILSSPFLKSKAFGLSLIRSEWNSSAASSDLALRQEVKWVSGPNLAQGTRHPDAWPVTNRFLLTEMYDCNDAPYFSTLPLVSVYFSLLPRKNFFAC